MKQHQIDWLVHGATLKRQTAMSLADRCKHFQKEFPGMKMNTALLRLVYRKHGIKKKKLQWYKQAKGMTPEHKIKLLSTVKQLLTKAKKDGYRIVYIDETMFTSKTLPETEWSLPKENMQVDLKRLEEPTLALLAGISKEKGMEHC